MGRRKRRLCRECGGDLTAAQMRRSEGKCYGCRNGARPKLAGRARKAQMGRGTRVCSYCGDTEQNAPLASVVGEYICSKCRAFTEDEIRYGLTDMEWGLVRHAARLMGDYQRYLTERPGRIKPKEKPQTADDYISAHIASQRRQVTLLCRTIEYARLRGYFIPNATNSGYWAAHLARKKGAKKSA